ncbi:nuclear transport factor 2 family protein [Geodermatophilus sp. SYSU D00691]
MEDDGGARLARVEARLELQELLGRYALAVDDHDADALAECFTDDAVFASPNSPPSVGRDAVVDFFRVRFDRYGATLHVPHFQVLHELTGDRARGTVVARAELATADDTVVTVFRYEDEYARDGGRWRFRRRDVLTLYAMPLRELTAGGLAWPERKRWPGRAPSASELPPA